jgi:hypothetical protein
MPSIDAPRRRRLVPDVPTEPTEPTETIELTHGNAAELFRAIRAGELEVVSADIPQGSVQDSAGGGRPSPPLELGSPGDTVRALTRALFHSRTVDVVRLRVRRAAPG